MPYVLVGVAILGWLLLRRSGSGWSRSHSGITLSGTATAWLDRLVERVPFGIVVTSGTRTIESQTTAMLALSDKQLYSDYDDGFVTSLLAVPRTQAAWLPLVRAAYADGTLSPSGHLAGLAVDLRTRDLSETQIATLTDLAEALGGYVHREYEPPHLHVQLPASTAATGTSDPSTSIDAGTSDYSDLDADPYATSDQE